MYPVDLLKVRCFPRSPTAVWMGRLTPPLQTRMQVVNPSPAAVYTGISNAMITISRVEGFRSLWRGLSSVVLGAGTFSPQLEHGHFPLTGEFGRPCTRRLFCVLRGSKARAWWE